MQRLGDRLLLSPSDLIGFLECPHLTALDLAVATGRLSLEPTRTDAGDLVARKGDAHERAYLDALSGRGLQPVEITRPAGPDGMREAADRTREAMRAGAAVIYQAVLFDGHRWRGTADFLERVERPCSLGPWSYEVADTKLARRVKPYFLLQLCCYSELLAREQGLVPKWVHVVLGSRERASFRLADFAAYARRVTRELEAVVAEGRNGTYPEPVEHCGLCRWRGHCDAQRERDDHLSLVAHMRRSQIKQLRTVGITTVAQLAAAAPEARPGRIGTGAYAALRTQAELQVLQRADGVACYELLDPEAERGFARLPRPAAGDLFFDMEGDPFFEDGLEYLFGVTWIEGGEPRFRAFWATDRGEEKRAFEDFVDFVMERLEREPDLHVYHYAPYEPTALKRLMGLHATREEELDRLLRRRVMVDLYAVVRQALRVGQSSYSIKALEALYMPRGRDTAVTDGGDSIVEFERFLEDGERGRRAAIERYNEDDCRSTWLLRDWLLERRDEAITRFGKEIAWRPAPQAKEPAADDNGEDEDARAALLAGEPGEPGDRDESQRARWLLGQLLDYHRREAKPAWWAYFDRREADEQQLVELDSEALGGLRDSGQEPEPLPLPSRSLVHTLAFNAQEHKVAPGKFVDPHSEQTVKVEGVDDAAGLVRICRAKNRRDEPLPTALIPGGPYDTKAQRGALRRFAADVLARGLDGDGSYRALRGILRSKAPRTSVVAADGGLQAGGFDLEEAKRVAAGLDGSHLVIQGPPGSGKTYNAAHLVLHLLENGAKVGVASSSHAAIANLLHEIEKYAETPFRAIKKGGKDSAFASRLSTPLVENSDEVADLLDPDVRLVAGTAWVFAREELDGRLDYLFIDEAGQISLADALAMGTAACNLVLVGDPLQLAQVSQAVHPPGAGASVLEHLLNGQATIPPDRGLFIEQTRRMHPDVCAFVSEAIYQGRLRSVPDCARQRIDAPGTLTGTGVRWIGVEHDGNVRQSPEEAAAIARYIEDLLRGEVTDAEGHRRPLRREDVMVVAPYNAQVRCLGNHLPPGVRIGTVDKFQGQEAAIAFFSMATSSGEEIPRNVDFLFSRNRLNVAVSRARCLAVLVANPTLLRVRCRTAEQMRLVNALCLLVEMANGASHRTGAHQLLRVP